MILFDRMERGSGVGVRCGREGAGRVVIEAGIVAAYVIAWVVGKTRRAAGRVDAEVDTAIDAGLDKLHEVVAAKLGAHPALADAAEGAAGGQGQVTELTRQRLELEVTAAAGKDDAFGQAVTALVTRLRAAEQAAGVSVTAGPGSRVFTEDAHAQASGGGTAFGQIGGDVHTVHLGPGGGPADPQRPGRERH
ncbi:MAG TPA: chromosome partitioning protein [Actinocatenispora sp.]